jgi:hypothetical protein
MLKHFYEMRRKSVYKKVYFKVLVDKRTGTVQIYVQSASLVKRSCLDRISTGIGFMPANS